MSQLALEQDLSRLDRPDFSIDSSRHSQAHFRPPASITSIPTEVLCMIFEAGKMISVEDPFEILVSQIENRWRAAAVHHARLWTRVVFDTSARHAEEMADHYIHRSGALPLDVIYRIKLAADVDLRDLNIFFSMSKLVCSRVERWNRLWVTAESPSALAFFLAELPDKAPILRSLEISLNLQPWMSPDLPPKIFIGGAPSLASLLLKGVIPSGLPPLATVSNLRIHTPFNTTSVILPWGVFDEFRSLSHLALSNVDIERESASNVEISTLQTLSLYYVPNCPGMLEMISAPLLHTLYMDPIHRDELHEIATWPSTASRFPILSSLSVGLLEIGQVPTIVWQGLMRVFPKVMHFTILRTQFDNLAQALWEASASLWPNLKILSFPEANHVEFLEKILSRRREEGCPIEKLQLSTHVMAKLGEALLQLQDQTDVEESNVCEAMAQSWTGRWLSDEEVDQDEVDIDDSDTE
ncbi:hypothetical protein HWV62_7334 [Athelia sp. TMB]|nr:hypothetical protein HWV62_7334 [Athelia sp. TMB]